MDVQDHTPARNPKWLVLRVPGKQTAEYEQHFSELGLRCWAPLAWVKRRLPRKRIGFWTLTPVLPSYLFLHAHDVPAFRALKHIQRQDALPMLIGGRFVVLDDEELNGLREFDRRSPEDDPRNKKTPAPTEPPPLPVLWKVGDQVVIGGKLFKGMQGEVIGVKGNDVKVAIKNPAIKVDISGFLLTKMG